MGVASACCAAPLLLSVVHMWCAALSGEGGVGQRLLQVWLPSLAKQSGVWCGICFGAIIEARYVHSPQMSPPRRQACHVAQVHMCSVLSSCV